MLQAQKSLSAQAPFFYFLHKLTSLQYYPNKGKLAKHQIDK